MMDRWHLRRSPASPPRSATSAVSRSASAKPSATGGRSGTFDTATGFGAGVTTTVSYTATDVLLTLRRQGRGRALSPSELAEDMMISTSAMTNRLDRLQKRGLIERQADPSDRRALRIVLTETGFALADRIVVSHVATEERLVSALSGEERAQLRRLLAKIGEARP